MLASFHLVWGTRVVPPFRIPHLGEHHEGAHSELPGLLHLLEHVREAMPQAPGHRLDLHLKVLPGGDGRGKRRARSAGAEV